jgi:hypothetical protein
MVFIFLINVVRLYWFRSYGTHIDPNPNNYKHFIPMGLAAIQAPSLTPLGVGCLQLKV